ncbi:hypothetical protein NDA12_007729 [Ustilago hordei]|nr:hypothetical protein NDA12_007729 [Ustilago hordei]
MYQSDRQGPPNSFSDNPYWAWENAVSHPIGYADGCTNLSGVSCLKPRSGVSVDDDEVDDVGDKVGGVNTSVQCVDLMLEVIPRPQWTTAFGSIYIQTANLLWVPSDVR